MPEDASYIVDMSLSTYGQEDEIVTEDDIAGMTSNQIAEMEKSNSASK